MNSHRRTSPSVILTYSGGSYRGPPDPSPLAWSPPPHRRELSPGIDDVSLDPPVDQWAPRPLGAGSWQSIIRGHNTFSPVSQALIVIQVHWSSRGRRRAVLSYVSRLAERGGSVIFEASHVASPDSGTLR